MYVRLLKFFSTAYNFEYQGPKSWARPCSNLEGKVQVATLLKAAADESLTLSSVAARREVTRFLL